MQDGFMFKRLKSERKYLSAFCAAGQNPVRNLPSVLRKYLGVPVQSHTKGESRYDLCRELTPVAAGGSERLLSSNRPEGRVDFIPKGIPMQDQGSLAARW